MNGNGSDSLDPLQAIRYGVSASCAPSGAPDNARVETNAERRKRKLELLCASNGLEAVAATAGLSAASLDQIIKGVLLPPKKGDQGTRSPRSLGDSAARAIEDAYQLGRGWFDNDDLDIDMTAKELQLLGYFRELNGDDGTQELVLENLRGVLERRAKMLEEMRRAMNATAPHHRLSRAKSKD